uniref:PfkB family carbohydrate kinase n=1 Tax=Eubacterium cellulosolvens TaxID=29322 RepID=UPI0004835D1C|nr:PfkB family carbohydrate kinase [[Eubacterium] cellulosolvens]
MYDVTAMGELLIDFTPCGTSEAGRTLFEQNPGGAPANVLVAMSKLGLKTAFIGKVGEDMHGELLRQTLINNGVETKGLIEDPDVFTTLAFVQLKDGERSFSFARKPGADTQIRADEVNMDILNQTRIFHFGSLSLTNEPARSATIYAVEQAKKAGALISYDPNYRAPLWPSQEAAEQEMRSVIKYVDIMKVSDEETKLLTGVEDPYDAAQILLDQGVKCVVITMGKDGAMLRTERFTVKEPSQTRKVVDTTGAGDSFWGGLLSRFAEEKVTPEELTQQQASDFIRFANIVAGLCVEKRGAIPAMPNRDDVMYLYNLKLEKF